MKELGGNRSVSKTGPAFSGGGNWSKGPIPTSGQLSWVRGEAFKAESEIADMW